MQSLSAQSTTNLSSAEINRYYELKTIIKRSFFDLGTALREIKDRKLYKAEYSTFEQFCIDELKISRSHGYRLIDAVEVVENVSNWGHLEPPKTESVARELTGLSKSDQIEVWNQANILSEGKEVTAESVAKIVQEKMRSGPDERLTPSIIFEISFLSLKGVDLDPCADLEKTIKASSHFTKEDDALNKDWFGKCFVHPPESQVESFVAKTMNELWEEKIDGALLYLPAEPWRSWNDLIAVYPRMYLSELDPGYKSGRMLVLVSNENKFMASFEAETEGFGWLYGFIG